MYHSKRSQRSCGTANVNSLAPGGFGCNFNISIFKLTLLIGTFRASFDKVLRWMIQDLTDDKSTLIQVMAWCCQATSHYLSQCWPRSTSPYGVIRPQWVNHHLHTYLQIHVAMELRETVSWQPTADMETITVLRHHILHLQDRKMTALTHWSLRDVIYRYHLKCFIFKCMFSVLFLEHFLWIMSQWILVRWWLGAIKQHAITWTKIIDLGSIMPK